MITILPAVIYIVTQRLECCLTTQKTPEKEIAYVAGAPNDRFLGNICSEPSRMAKIFESPRKAKISKMFRGDCLLGSEFRDLCGLFT